MASDTAQVRQDRVFVQLEELHPFDLVQCGGVSTWNKPRGAITPIREQSLERVGEEVIAAFQRASADMAAFTVRSRLRAIGNFMLNLRCQTNWQVLWKLCGDPTSYYGYSIGLAWQKCPPGDMTGEPLAVIEGDNVPIHMDNPFSAIYGPELIDFTVKFLSRRTLAETGIVQDIVMFEEECLEDCGYQADNGQYGYLVSTAQAGSPTDQANVWFTEDDADEWALVSAQPFAAAEDISSVVKQGTVNNHRIMVARGSTDAGAPAEIAYADVTVFGQTAWVNVDVGEVNGEYINMLEWPVFNRCFAITNLGNIYKSSDGGATWAIIYNDATNTELHDISFTKDGEGWIVGDNDLLLYTTDWGSTIDAIDGPNDGLLNLMTCDVDMEKKLIVGDSAGNIYGTVDRAANWVETPPQGVVPTSVQRIRSSGYWKWCIVHVAATAPAEGNSRVLRSTDGGATWRLWQLETNIVPNNGLYALFVVDLNRCVVGGAPYPVGGTSFFTRTETNIDRIVT